MTKIISRAVTATSRSKYTPSSSSSKSGGVGVSTLVESVGGSSVDILKTTSSVAESDNNVYSALRTTKEISTRAISKLIDDTVAGNISFLKDINVAGAANIAGILTASEVDATEIKGTNGTFANLLKAAAVTITGLATLGSVEATTLHATAGTIDALQATTINVGASVTSPLFIGALQGNADTATKLKTTHYLWGQAFDGTGDVSGDIQLGYANKIILLNNDTHDIIYDRRTDDTQIRAIATNGYGIGFRNNNAWTIFCDPYNDVGIKTTSPAYGLDVNGTFRATSDAYMDATIGTRNYASQLTGWRVDNTGSADFRKMYADELRVQAFTADISQALAGSDYLTKSVTKLSANFVIPSAVNGTVSIIVDDLEGFPATRVFADGDYIMLRPFDYSNGGLTIAKVWGTVALDTTFGTNGFLNNTQRYTFTVSSLGNGAGLTVFKGSEVLDYGTSGSGVIARTVLDSAGSPYSQVVTWVNDPSVSTNYTVHARLGNLNGIANCSGYGLYSNKAFLTDSILVGDLTKAGNYMEYSNGALTVNGVINVVGGNAATNSSVATAINNVQVGGTNLFGFNKGIVFNIDIPDNSINGYHCYYSSSNLIGRIHNIGLEISGNYTVSFYAKASVPLVVNVNLCDYEIYNSYITLTEEYIKYVFTFLNVTNYVGASMYGFLDIENTGDVNAVVDIKNIKIERGTKATDWSPAPEDTTSAISTAQSNAAADATSKVTALSNAHGGFTYISSKGIYTGTLTATQVNAVEINAASIATGYLSADRIAVNTLDGNKIVSNSITATQIQAGTITATEIAAGAITADKIAAQSITTGKLSADLFDGNYINATYINAATVFTNALTAGTIYAGNAVISGLKVTNATVSGTLNGVTGTFNNLSSLNNRMILSDTLLEFKNSDDMTTTPIVYNRWLKIGSNLLSSSDGDVLSMMDVYVNRVTTYLNVGIHIDVSGVVYENSRSQTSSTDAYRGNRALYIDEGSICGFRLNGRPVSGGHVISKLDSWIFPQATSTVTYYLPLNCEMGQMFFFKKLPGTASYNIAINPSSSDTMWWNGNSGETSAPIGDDKTYTLVYCKYNAHWGVTISAY